MTMPRQPQQPKLCDLLISDYPNKTGPLNALPEVTLRRGGYLYYQNQLAGPLEPRVWYRIVIDGDELNVTEVDQ